MDGVSITQHIQLYVDAFKHLKAFCVMYLYADKYRAVTENAPLSQPVPQGGDGRGVANKVSGCHRLVLLDPQLAIVGSFPRAAGSWPCLRRWLSACSVSI